MTASPQEPAGSASRFGLPAIPGIAAATSFAMADVLAKVVLLLGSDVLTMLLLRSVIGLALMAVWLVLGPKSKVDARVRWLSMGNGLLFAGVTFGLFKAIDIIDVPTAVLCYFIYPLLTGLTASLVGLDRVRWRGFLFAAVAFCGLALMIGAHPAGVAFLGVVMAFIAACCRTGMLLLTRAFLVGADARVTTWYTQLASLAIFIVVSVGTQTWHGPQTASGWITMIALGVTTTAGVLFLFVSTVRVGPFRTALIMYLEPLMAAILSALVLAEVITPLQGLGAAIMLAALVAFQLWR